MDLVDTHLGIVRAAEGSRRTEPPDVAALPQRVRRPPPTAHRVGRRLGARKQRAADGSAGQGGEHSGSAGHSGDQAQQGGHGRNQGGATDRGAHQPASHTSSADSAGGRSFLRQLSVGTGYLALVLLGLTLLIGPANLLLRRRNPVSSYLRRDVGAWTAIISIVHVVVGLQVHGGGQLAGARAYFVAPDGGLLTNSFGLANWIGLAALVIVVGCSDFPATERYAHSVLGPGNGFNG